MIPETIPEIMFVSILSILSLSQIFRYKFFYDIKRPTVCVTCVWAGWDSVREQGKLEARKMLENAAESHTSGARFVRRLFAVRLFIFQISFDYLPCITFGNFQRKFYRLHARAFYGLLPFRLIQNAVCKLHKFLFAFRMLHVSDYR